MTAPRAPRVRLALVRALLYLYPPRFRRTFSDAMLDDARERLEQGGRISLRDLAASAAREWMAPTFVRAEEGLGTRRFGLLDDLVVDARLALRSLVRRPGFSATTIGILALGIGANTAIFSVVNAVLVRPLPFGDPGRLVIAWEQNAEGGSYADKTSPGSYENWRSQVSTFKDVAAYGGGTATISGGGAPNVVQAAWVTGNLFDVIGVPAASGRTFKDAETWNDSAPVVMLSDRLWARQFGRDPAIVGSRITVNELPYEVAGIVPPGREFPERNIDLWLTLRWKKSARQAAWWPTEHFLRVVAGLTDGTSLEQARADFRSVAGRLEQARPLANRSTHADITPLQEYFAGDARTPLLILLASTTVLLALVCANVANLLLVRASGRGRELSVRAALGAGRGRLARQLITEGLVLAGIGGALGVTLGVAGIGGLIAIQPPGPWQIEHVPIDARVLLFALAATCATGVLCGVASAVHGAGERGPTRPERSRGEGPRLRISAGDGSRTTTGKASRRARAILVSAEVALAVLLVTSAGLLLRSFAALRHVDPGFRVEHRAIAELVLPTRYDSDARILGLVDAVVERVEGTAGVAGVTYMSRLPLSGTTASPVKFRVEGRTAADDGDYLGQRSVAPNYFEVLGVPILHGRAFDRGDRDGAEPVIIINREAARRLFADENPIGRRITDEQRPTPRSRWYRIVGVVGDEHQHGVREAPQAELFSPFRANPSTRVRFVVDTPAAGARLEEAMRAAVTAADPLLPLSRFQPLEQLYSESLGRDRFLVTLAGAFAAIALILAALGVYGVTSEAATRRTQEIGIRVALGARTSGIARLIAGQGLVLTGWGLVLGLGGAAAGTRFLSGALFGVAPLDPLTFAGVPVVLGVTAFAASAVPALRAARLDPLVALRRD